MFIKIKRNIGHSYINKNQTQIAAREIGPPCKCRKRCRQLLLGKENEIFQAFWDLADYNKQNIY